MTSIHSPFILQLSSKPDVGSNMALSHMSCLFFSIEHIMTAVQRKSWFHFRGLSIVKFDFVPTQSPACPQKTLKEAPRLQEAASFNCSPGVQLQRWVSWQNALPRCGGILSVPCFSFSGAFSFLGSFLNTKCFSSYINSSYKTPGNFKRSSLTKTFPNSRKNLEVISHANGEEKYL